MPRDAVFAYYQHQIGDHFSTQGMRSNNRRRLERNRKFVDSPLEGTGFELVWGFPCQVVFSVYRQFFVRRLKGPFFIPSLTIRFPERAEWDQGSETLAKLGALPPSGACVWQSLDA